MSVLRSVLGLVRERPTVALVVATTALHLVVSLLLPASLGANESADLELFYEPVARSLVDGDGFVAPDGGPAVRYPPGFPVLLAAPVAVVDATGLQLSSVLAVLIATTMGASCGVLHLVGRRLVGPVAAVVGAGLWMLWPLNIWMAKQPNSEVPFTLLLLLALLATVRAAQRPDGAGRDAVLAGCALAGAALVRPAGLFLVAPLAGWLWYRRRRDPGSTASWRPAALVVVTMALLLVPWVTWASFASDELVPVASGGRDTVMDGLEVGIGEKGTEDGRTLPLPDDLRGLLEDLSGQDSDGDLPTTGSIVAAVVREVPERPVGVAELVAFKATRSWFATESLRFELPIAALQALTAGLLLAGSVRCWRGGPERRAALGLLLGVLGSSWLLTMAVISIVRYLTPSLGPALLLGGVALEPLVVTLRARWATGPHAAAATGAG